MHHGPVLANEEGVGAGDGQVVSALDAVGNGVVEDRQPAVVGGGTVIVPTSALSSASSSLARVFAHSRGQSSR